MAIIQANFSLPEVLPEKRITTRGNNQMILMIKNSASNSILKISIFELKYLWYVIYLNILFRL